MSSRKLTGWMWAEACELLDQAERLQRQFFRVRGRAGGHPSWEPPVDVFYEENEIIIIIALPGVPIERIEVTIDSRILIIRAQRELPFGGRDCVIERLEIPHGYFERRIELPDSAFELGAREWDNGCLILSLHKRI
uniref:Putative molecular chaperone n=1 Tax=uncultured bacterium CSL142 TaxID=1091569 RepID=G4WVN5_9BACT|nr:putative molecular chaperone [uncultured bacterium CSL142]